MGISGGPQIIRDTSLVLALEASDANSNNRYQGRNWVDLSGNNTNGSIIDGPSLNNDSYGSFNFNGINSYIRTNTNLTLSNATLLCWIKRNGTQDSYDGILFSRTPSLATGLHLWSGNQLGYHWNDLSSTYTWNSGLVIPNNTWCMIALTITPTEGIAYLGQGDIITSAINAIAHSTATSLNFNIGADPATIGRYFNGSIANIEIYNRALSAAEIQSNYNQFKTRFNRTTPNIVTYTSLNTTTAIESFNDVLEFSNVLVGYPSYGSANAVALVNETP
jgi:hypothetical protein